MRQIVIGFESLADVIRVQHRVHRRARQSVAAVRQDVSQRPHQHAEVAVKRFHAADRSAAVVIEPPLPVGALQPRHRQKRLQVRLHRYRAAPGPPPPCGVENVLCRFRCITSTPLSPGRVMPASAFMFAPSM